MTISLHFYLCRRILLMLIFLSEENLHESGHLESYYF